MTWNYASVLNDIAEEIGELSASEGASSNGEAAREFAIACTHLEDAIMRINRGFARKQGTFRVSDVQGGGRRLPRDE